MDEQKEMNHMRELVELLNRARRSYEQENTEIMSNYEYDKLYDELQELEEKIGTRMANSPTVNVGYEVLSELPKERHERPMLSLDKTKDVERLKEFLGGQKALISWKLDGLTVVLTYQNGELVKAVTRGNGVIGEVITNNAKYLKMYRLRSHIRENLYCEERQLFPIKISRRSMKRLRMWMRNIRIHEIFAAVLSVS